MGRRGPGDGSIHKRARDGRWVGVISWTEPSGRRRRREVVRATRREAAEALSHLQAQTRPGVSFDPDRQTVKEYLRWWLDVDQKPRVAAGEFSPTTWASYDSKSRVHLEPAFAGVRLRKLTAQHVRGLLADKLTAGLSPRTVQYLHAILRSALATAMRYELVNRNVAELVQAPTVRRDPIKALTVDEAAKLLKALEGDPLEALYLTAFPLGLRIGEALALTWSDVDLDARTVRVWRNLIRVDGRWALKATKTHADATLALPTFTVEALRRHRQQQRLDRLASHRGWLDLDLVFTGRRGQPIHSSAINKHLDELCKTAKVRRLTPHELLRHGCASLLKARGLDLKEIQWLLRHSRYQTTADIYTHLGEEVSRDAADRMDELFGGGLAVNEAVNDDGPPDT